ncbi:MAG: hypothetical protein KGQ93_05130 [Cyanobacteria bacterium REEB459]|nr:hypothetical protein [Cyanobacteria bacterium REEB459]
MSVIEQAIEQMFASRQLTRHDQKLLMTLFSQRDLNAKDAALIDRLYEALSQGRLRVVD